MEDEELVRLFLGREQTAVEETEKKYGARLYRFAYGMLKDRRDAEECVNDTWLKAWYTIPPHHPRCLWAYLLKLCRFTVFDLLDRQNARKRKTTLVELTEEMEQCLSSGDAEKEIDVQELGDSLTVFLKKMSPESRLVFVRRYWFADSVAEIAQRYHISESKVKILLFRTRNKLRDYLKKEGFCL